MGSTQVLSGHHVMFKFLLPWLSWGIFVFIISVAAIFIRLRIRSRQTSAVDHKIKVFQLSKVGSSLLDCEDAFEVSSDNKRIAVADGVSQSFAAQIWAQKLVKSLVLGQNNQDLENLISTTATDWKITVDTLMGPEATWNIKKKAEDGAQATFVSVALEDIKDSLAWHAELIGDSIVVEIVSTVNGPEKVTVYPPNYSEILEQNPETVSSQKPFIRGTIYSHNGKLSKGSQLLVMTDALAKFLSKSLTFGVSITAVFPFLFDAEELQDSSFETWVDHQRPKDLDDDDLTLVQVVYG